MTLDFLSVWLDIINNFMSKSPQTPCSEIEPPFEKPWLFIESLPVSFSPLFVHPVSDLSVETISHHQTWTMSLILSLTFEARKIFSAVVIEDSKLLSSLLSVYGLVNRTAFHHYLICCVVMNEVYLCWNWKSRIAFHRVQVFCYFEVTRSLGSVLSLISKVSCHSFALM